MASTKRQTTKEFNAEYNLVDINRDWFKKISKEEFQTTSKTVLIGKPTKVWKDVLRRFFKNKWNIFFLALFLIVILLAAIAPLMSRYHVKDPVLNTTSEYVTFLKPTWVDGYDEILYSGNLSDFLQGNIPGRVVEEISRDTTTNTIVLRLINPYVGDLTAWLGTDEIGRDVWVRLWSGTSWSLRLALLVATVEMTLGVSIGLYMGFNVGKATDTIVMRFIEIFKSVPVLVWMFVFAFVLGTSFFSIALSLIFVGWVGPVYTTRMYTLKIKDAEFIKAAESIGASNKRVLFSHILPNITGKLAVTFVHRIPAVIFFETSLVFLGITIGGDSNTPTLGNMINGSRGLDALFNQPYYAISTSLVILTIVISMQIIANGLRDAFDPKVSG